jgi:hypothetical protein
MAMAMEGQKMFEGHFPIHINQISFAAFTFGVYPKA